MARGRGLRWIAGWLLLTALAVAAFLSVEWEGVLAVLSGVETEWLLVAVASNFLILVLWASQWCLLLPSHLGSISRFRVFEIVSAVSTVANGGPVLSGQATGVHLLARTGADHSVGLSVVAMDQLAEGMAKLGVVLAVTLVLPLPGMLRGGILGLAGGVALLALALAWTARRGRDPSVPDVVPRGEALARWLGRFAGHLEALRSPRTVFSALGLAGTMKVAELGGIVAVQMALGLGFDAGRSLLVLASVALATMITVTPANLGVYEASAFGAYRLTGVDPATATALAVVQHVAFLVPAAGTGWLLLSVRGVRRALGPRAEAAAEAEIPS